MNSLVIFSLAIFFLVVLLAGVALLEEKQK
jgi:hypothetical protein